MIYTERIQKAIKFAAKTHNVYQQQKRKGKEVPYIVHPLTVGTILCLAGASEDVIIAGMLHDTIEDSAEHKKVSAKMITERFGESVTKLVLSVTEQNKKLSWEQRKQEAIEHVKHFTHDSVLVKSADVISNMTELMDDYAKCKESAFKHFHANKEKTLNNQSLLIKELIKRWPKNPLAKDLLMINKWVEKVK